MHEEELRDVFKSSKRLAFDIFDKVAVGDIRNDFVK